MATPGDWRDTLQPGERLAVQQKLMSLALQLLGAAAADKRAAVETASREFEQKVFDGSGSRDTYLNAISKQLAALTQKLRQAQSAAPVSCAAESATSGVQAAPGAPPPARGVAAPSVAAAGAAVGAGAAAAGARHTADYWRQHAALRDKYLPLIEKVVVPALRGTAADAAHRDALARLQSEVLPLLRSTPAAPVPFCATLAELAACNAWLVALIRRVQPLLVALRQKVQAHSQLRQQQQQQLLPAAAASAQAAAPSSAKRRADAALPDLPDGAKRRQAALAAAVGPPSDAVAAAVAAVRGAQLVTDPTPLGALLASGAPAGWLVRCELEGAPALLALLPARYPDAPPLPVFAAGADAASAAAYSLPLAQSARAKLVDALRGSKPPSLPELLALWQRTWLSLRATDAAPPPRHAAAA